MLAPAVARQVFCPVKTKRSSGAAPLGLKLSRNSGRRFFGTRDWSLFGKSKGEEMAKASGAPLLARLPIEPELAKLCDEGRIA
jgi:hypothetical protein